MTQRYARAVCPCGKPVLKAESKFCSQKCLHVSLSLRALAVRRDFIGPLKRWEPFRRCIDWDTMPSVPLEGHTHYFDPSLASCRKGHCAPLRLHKGAWECMQCINELKLGMDGVRRRDLLSLSKLIARVQEEVGPMPGEERQHGSRHILSSMLWVPQGRGAATFRQGFDFTILPRTKEEGLRHETRGYFDGRPCEAGHLAPFVWEPTSDGHQWKCAACRAAGKARRSGRAGIMLVPIPDHLLNYAA